MCTSSDVAAPVLATVAVTVTFWPALTIDGAISRSEYLKVVYDLKCLRYFYENACDLENR